MKSLKYILVSTLFLAACSDKAGQSLSNQNIQVDADSAAIVGGRELKPGSREMVSTVGLYDLKEKFICTGTLISSNLVLTAAHCVGADPSKMVVVFKDNFSNAKKEDMREVVAAKVNTSFDPGKATNTADIAVIKFDDSVDLPAGYKPARILRDFSILKKGTEVVAAGYGLNWTWVTRKGAGTLRSAELKISEDKFSETEISLDQSVFKGVCSGDSGGPGYIDIDGQLYVWGVVSRGDSLPGRIFPKCMILSIYTRIDVHAPWIVEAMESLR